MKKMIFNALFFTVVNLTVFAQGPVKISNFECVKEPVETSGPFVPFAVKFKTNQIENAQFVQIDCLNEKNEVIYAMTGFYNHNAGFPVFYLEGQVFAATEEESIFRMNIPKYLYPNINKFTLIIKDDKGYYSNQLAAK